MITYNKVNEENGWLSNMSAHSINYENKIWRTAEALFQAMRFNDETIKEIIRNEKSPMGAKMKSKKHKNSYAIELRSAEDIENMKLCVKLKLEQHPDLKRRLLATGDNEIVEDIGKRNAPNHLFWGKRNTNNGWIGTNTMGKIWMEFREQLKIENLTEMN